MQRFYLNLHRGEALVAPDDEGAEFACIEEAFLEAFGAAQELWTEFLRKRQDPREYAYHIADGRGVVLMELPFAEILENCCSVRPQPIDSSRKPKNAVIDTHELLSAMENARRLSLQTAELLAGLRATRKSLRQIQDSTRATLKRLGEDEQGL
jgi:hypothetical protein